jgi:hypothetical protein
MPQSVTEHRVTVKLSLVMSGRFGCNQASLKKVEMSVKAVQKKIVIPSNLIEYNVLERPDDKQESHIIQFPNHSKLSRKQKQGPIESAYHVHQLPNRIARLCTNAQPVLCAGAIERDFFVWAGIGVLIVQVRRTFRDGVVSADNFEGLCAAGSAEDLLI